MRTWLLTFLVFATIGLSGCTSTLDQTERRRSDDADSASKKAGKVAHDIAKEADEAAKKAGRELKKAGKDVREGWKEAEHEDPIKPKK